MNRKLALGAMAIGVLTTLTACDPPIPQSLLVAQAEATVQCGEPGDISLYTDMGFSDLAYTWAELMATSCPDLVITPADDKESANLVASGVAPSCEAIAKAPVGYESSAVAFYLDEAFSLNLSGEAIAGIFSGEITNWSDPVIAQLNPEIEFPDLEILVNPSSTQPAIEAMQNWVSEMAPGSSAFSLLQDDPEAIFFDIVSEFEPGSVALVPLSDALTAGATVANIITADGATVLPDQQSLYSGSTMFGFESMDQEVTALFDAQRAPHASPGTTEVAVPYQAMFPVNLYLCGEDSLALRAAARFLVRLDAQGLVATSSILSLDEDVRVAAATVLGTGLPVPELAEVSE